MTAPTTRPPGRPVSDGGPYPFRGNWLYGPREAAALRRIMERDGVNESEAARRAIRAYAESHGSGYR